MNDMVLDDVSTAEKNIRHQLKEMTKPKVGRPTKFTKDVVDEICIRLMTGESLLSISQDKQIPDYSNIMRRMHKDTKFRNKIARAREAQMDALVDQMIDIAMYASPEEVHKARLVTDLMKWTASKLKPKVYGDHVEIDQNVNVTFQNAVPRPKAIEADAISSVPKQIPSKTDAS